MPLTSGTGRCPPTFDDSERMHRFFRLSTGVLAVALLAVACRDVVAPSEDPAATTYASTLSVNLSQMKRTSSGLYYQDIVVGSGKAAAKDSTVKVYYTGSLTSGHVFDTNVNKTPFSFVIGQGTVIKGWDEGFLAGDPMRVNGRRRFVIPPELGYGSKTNGTIPAGSVLVFDVTLVAVGS
jgi:FKBP-type peptidyl-prolyl cis-trans isomerase